MDQLSVKAIVLSCDKSTAVVQHVCDETTDKLLDRIGTGSSELCPNDYTASTINSGNHPQPFEYFNNLVCKLDDAPNITSRASSAHNSPRRPIINNQSTSSALGCYNSAPTYECNTQRNVTGNPVAIQLGFNGRISRYTFGATISYFIKLDSFPTTADGKYATECFEHAINAWGPIPVQFKRVFAREKAFFTIVSIPENNNRILAEAFFPSDPPEKRIFKVYFLAFTPIYRMAMINVFCHELGHVLGLRHEFAAWKEPYEPSVTWDIANNESVMTYHKHPMGLAVHELDIILVDTFYAYDGDTWQEFTIDVVEPTLELAER